MPKELLTRFPRNTQTANRDSATIKSIFLCLVRTREDHVNTVTRQTLRQDQISMQKQTQVQHW